jgi:hypothetical protein
VLPVRASYQVGTVESPLTQAIARVRGLCGPLAVHVPDLALRRRAKLASWAGAPPRRQPQSVRALRSVDRAFSTFSGQDVEMVPDSDLTNCSSRLGRPTRWLAPAPAMMTL